MSNSPRSLLKYRIAVPLCVWVVIAAMSTGQEAPLATFKGHTNAIYTVAFSPDGKSFVTGSFDNSAKLWDAATGKVIREFSGAMGHQSLILNVAFTPTGDAIATGGADNFARIWDIPINSPVREFAALAGVTSVGVSADGKMVGGACSDGSVKLWTTADGKQTANLVGHPGGATGLAFSANGLMVATSGADGVVRFWNAADGKALGQVGAHASAVTGVALNPNNVVAHSIGEDGLLKFWQLPPVASRPLPPHADAVTTMFLSPDGSNVYTGGADKALKQSAFATGALTKDYLGAPAAIQSIATGGNPNSVVAGMADGKLAIWNPADGKQLLQASAHAGGVVGLAFHPNQTTFYTAGEDGLLKSWLFPINAPKSITTPDRVLAAILSPDGKRLFTGGADKIARSWLYPVGTAERQFMGHTGPVTALSVSPDGNTLITASADETIRFWNVGTGMETARVSGHVGGTTSLALTPQNNLLVSGGEDGTVKIWQLPLVAPKSFAHPDAVNALTLSADGNRVLTIGNDKQARLWNLANGQVERPFTAGNGPISAIAIAPDSLTVAIAGVDKSLAINKAGVEVKKIPALPGVASALAFSVDGTKIAAALADNTIRLLNIADAKELKSIPGHTAAITALSYTPKGDLLVSASTDKTVRLWNSADGVAKGQLTHPGAIASMSISKDGLKIAMGGADKTVSLWTLADSKSAGTLTTPAEVSGVSFSPDGLKIAVAGADNKVRLYGIDGKLQEIFLHDGPATGVAFLPDGKRLISSSADKSAKIWTAALLAQGAHTGPVRQVSVTPQADRVFSAGDDKTLRVWDAKTAKEIRSIPAHDGPVVGFSLSTDLTKVATAGADKTAKVWTIADGKAITTIPLAGPAQAVAISPNGLRIAVAFADPAQHIRAYDVVTGRELQTIADPTLPTRSLAFLADNRTLIAAGDDKLVSIGDVAVQSSLPVHPAGATGAIIHPAGTQAITAGKDKTIKLWDLAGGKELKAYGPPTEVVTALGASKDFAAVAAAAGKVVKVWQVADGKELVALTHPAEVVAVNFNADRTRLITGATDNLARVWEIATGRLLQTFSHGAAVRCVAFHPSLPAVITASADKTVMVHPLTIQRAIEVAKTPVRAITVTANGTHVLTGDDANQCKGWNTGTGVADKSFDGAAGPIYAVAASKTVQLVASAGAEKIIRIYNFADAKLIGSVTAPAVVRNLAFHPTLPIIGAACEDKSIHAWNIAFLPAQPLPAEFGKLIQSFTQPEAISSVAFAATGPLYSSGLDKNVKQWKLASDTPTHNFQHPNLVDAVAFDPSGKLLATGCHDGNLRIFDVEKNAVSKTIVAHVQTQPTQQQNPIYSVAWTPDGRQVLSASYDKTMKLWDATAGTLVREFKGYDEKTFPKGHRDQVFTVAFTKDGKTIATGSSDRSIKLWNVADGSVLREFVNPNIKQSDPKVDNPAAHPGWVYSVKYTADEKYLVSVGSAPKNQGYLAVWNVADGKMLYGAELPYGPIYSVAISKDGTQLLLGCGPKDRLNPASEAVTIKMPVK